MWVNIPLLNKGHTWLETDATIRLRVAKPYDTSYGETFLNSGHQSSVKGQYRFNLEESKSCK